MLKHIEFLAFKLSDSAFILITNVKMPTVAVFGILIFMRMINFLFSCVEHEKCAITSGPGPRF